ncbi:hypothetical protein BAUCODRAFT_76471 [Baudoinia panamericana UAMH 10762]|uniref:Zn(2)-C6 fungal-type domain-containing protein n=1 Tax=Baudoinia panamericana (strain UAMH 10762) TaxID=717646 RepID=M2LGK2_BAUPA|nr:uncharacterized protein BAUCODRAFT_76471 [Baudoinia panamericana UAMH 10762]EMC93207.1 hypothetical protein BAUCODRAFT_76471 [Baudoinia panamericana UAMH 10762]
MDASPNTQQTTPSSATNPTGAGAIPSSQTPGHPSFRRQRASRACETCHARKVRCDAASLGVPCTNCVAFSIECKIPAPKRKKTGGSKKDRRGSYTDTGASPSARSDAVPGQREIVMPRQLTPRGFQPDEIGMNTSSGMPDTEVTEAYASQQHVNNGTYVQYMKPKFARAPIKEAGRVAYLGESSNLSLLVQDRHGTTDVVHYPLPENVRGARARVNELDNVEIDILHQRGAFLLPPRQLCDELVDAFFRWIAPVVPVINRSKFMRRYRDPKNPPSLLLLQAILLAGSRVCSNPQLMDANGSTTPAAMTFYKRAKALYDANYEDDRVTIVQALILMGWYWEGPEGRNRHRGEIVTQARSDVAADVTKNVFYWSRVAVIVAQGSGMHRSVEGSQLSRADKRLWKRIWWTLFTRDRSVAVALGRPVGINIEDSDVEMVSEDDFIDDEGATAGEFAPDPIHVQFFLNYVKLCEIMGLVLSQQYSVASKARNYNAIDLTHSDMALADWLQNCPPEVRWEPQRHHFWSALLHSNYYTTLCLLHRAHMPSAGAPEARPLNGYPEETAYPSRTIAYQAAGMITSIIQELQNHDQLRFTPAFIVYSLFSALIMHVYQMRSSNQSIVSATQQRLTTCMTALRDVSKVWLVAKMVHTLFESILGNKVLEERLQKAAGRRHGKGKQNGYSGQRTAKNTPPPGVQQQSMPPTSDAHKRKFDDMELGYANGPPSGAQMSYERSRPQSPVISPNRELSGQQQLPTISAGSPNIRQSTDAFMGTSGSRVNTRPTTPFNTYSYPGTPPDLFLHTRNSPKISEDLWQNYEPAQLFPPEVNGMGFSVHQSPDGVPVDPALRRLSQQQQASGMGMQQDGGAPQAQMHQQQPPQLPTYHPDTQAWSHLPNEQMMQQHAGAPGGGRPPLQDDQWSTSTGTGPIVPTTLNVGDWFEFFGIPNGDLAALGGVQGLAAHLPPPSSGGGYG